MTYSETVIDQILRTGCVQCWDVLTRLSDKLSFYTQHVHSLSLPHVQPHALLVVAPTHPTQLSDGVRCQAEESELKSHRVDFQQALWPL